MWEEEEIGLQDELYVRVHYQKVDKKTKNPRPSAFYNTPKDGNDLSSDWSNYHSAEESRELIGKQYRHGKTEFKNPMDFLISALVNEDIYGMNREQTTLHTPKYQDPEPLGDPNNRSHVGIFGNKTDEEIRLKFVGISKWAIGPE